jgi:hypothetical protein
VSWGSAGVHLWVGEQGMVVDRGEENNKGVLHIMVDIKVFHVVVGGVDCGVSWYQSIHPRSETSHVCLGQRV